MFDKQYWIRIWIIVLGNTWVCMTVFFGPLWDDLVRRSGNNPGTAQTYSIFAFIISFFLLSFLLKQRHIKTSLYISFSAALGIIAVMWYLPVTQSEYLGYILFGLAAGTCLLSYTRILIYGFSLEIKTEITALFNLLILAIQYILKHCILILGSEFALYILFLSMILGIWVTSRLKPEQLIDPATLPSYRIPWKLILISGLVIAIIYLNYGLTFNLMYHPMEKLPGYMNYLEMLPAILISLSIFLLFRKLNPLLLLYFCMIIMGMAYIGYIIAHRSNNVIIILFQVSSALSDLFIAIYGSTIALKYGRDNKVFWPLALSMLIGVMLGQYTGQKLLGSFQRDYLSTIGISLLTLLISLAVIPLLFWYIRNQTQKTQEPLNDTLPQTTSTEELAIAKVYHAIATLPASNRLTPREIEIAILLLERYDQETISKRLFITTSTLKTHIGHIYQKFQVSRKKEFIDWVEKIYAESH